MHIPHTTFASSIFNSLALDNLILFMVVFFFSAKLEFDTTIAIYKIISANSAKV